MSVRGAWFAKVIHLNNAKLKSGLTWSDCGTILAPKIIMATEIIQFDYRYIVLDDEPSAAAIAVRAMSDLGISLIGFSEFPHSPGRSQLDLIAEDTDNLVETAAYVGLQLSPRRTGFLIRGESRPAPVVADILMRLAAAHIRVTSLHAVAAGAGRFGALLWVRPPDVEVAAKVLGDAVNSYEPIDQSSEVPFPAIDAPAWAMADASKSKSAA